MMAIHLQITTHYRVLGEPAMGIIIFMTKPYICWVFQSICKCHNGIPQFCNLQLMTTFEKQSNEMPWQDEHLKCQIDLPNL